MPTSDVISPAVFAVFWLVLIHGVQAEVDAGRGRVVRLAVTEVTDV